MNVHVSVSMNDDDVVVAAADQLLPMNDDDDVCHDDGVHDVSLDL